MENTLVLFPTLPLIPDRILYNSFDRRVAGEEFRLERLYRNYLRGHYPYNDDYEIRTLVPISHFSFNVKCLGYE